MGSRWFIPLTLLVFMVLVACLWAYLSASEGDVSPASRQPPQILFAESRPPAPNPALHHPVAPPPDSTRRKIVHAKQRIDPALPDISEKLDDVALRLRSDLCESPIIELIAARKELAAASYDSALNYFDRALRSSPKNVEALSGKAMALASLNRLEESRKAYAAIIAIAPRDASARYNYGVLLYRMSIYSEASDQFRELVALQPDHVKGQYNLATLAQRAGRLSEAREAWMAVLVLQPELASAWFNLGVLLTDFEEPLEASRCFAIQTVLEPSDPDGYINLARAHAEAGNLENALDPAIAAAALLPCDDEVLEVLKDIYCRMNTGQLRSFPQRLDDRIWAGRSSDDNE